MSKNVISFQSYLDRKKPISPHSHPDEIDEEEFAQIVYRISKTEKEINHYLNLASEYVCNTDDPRVMYERIDEYRKVVMGAPVDYYARHYENEKGLFRKLLTVIKDHMRKE